MPDRFIKGKKIKIEVELNPSGFKKWSVYLEGRDWHGEKLAPLLKSVALELEAVNA